MPKKMHPVLGEVHDQDGPTSLSEVETTVPAELPASTPAPEPDTEIIYSPNPPPAPRMPIRARARKTIKNTLIKIARRVISELDKD